MTNKDEDQDWLDALAGKPNAEADSEVTRRATLLRQAIQRHDAALNVNEFDTEAGLQKLKFRMRREELSGESKPAFFSTRFVQYAMAASIVLTVGLSMRLYLHEQPIQNEADVIGGMRGGIRTQVIYAKKPEDTANSIVADLASVGRTARMESKSDLILINVDAAGATQPEASRNKEWDLFERYSITVGGSKAFQLEIHPEAKPSGSLY